MYRNRKIVLIFGLILLVAITSAQGQEQQPGGDDLAAKTQNPVGAMYTIT